jgi:hypothetical protein
MKMESPHYTEVYAGLCTSAQTLAALLVFAVLFGFGETVVYRVLGLIWAVTGLTFYLNYIGGLYGVLLTVACLWQASALLVNWASLVNCKPSFAFECWKLRVDLSQVNTTSSVLGASTLLVILT